MTHKQQNEFHQLLLSELQEIKDDVKQVRLHDLPEVTQKMAVMDERLTTLKNDVRAEARRDAQIYGGVGSAVASLIAIALAVFKH